MGALIWIKVGQAAVWHTCDMRYQSRFRVGLSLA